MPLGVTSALADLLVHHAADFSSMQNSVRSMTYILPGRFANADIIAETVFAALRWIDTVQDSLFAQQMSRLEIPQAPFNRYITEAFERKPFVERLSELLALTQCFQVVTEMMTIKAAGNRKRWQLILAVELFKAVLRFGILQNTNRMLLTPSVPRRDYDPATLSAVVNEAKLQGVTTKRKNRPNVGEITDVESFLVGRAAEAAIGFTPLNHLQTLDQKRWWIEILYIARPVIYAALMPNGARNSKTKNNANGSYVGAFLASLAIDTIARALTWRLEQVNAGSGASKRGLTELEKEEYQRRNWLIVYYLLRKPVYNNLTMPILQKCCDKMQNKMFISFFTRILAEYLPLWDKYHFYTSAN